MKKTFQVRQGDILIERVEKAPSNIVPRVTPENERGRVILAYGEISGHAHEIEKPEVATLSEIQDAMRALSPDYLLELNEPTAVVHQEHGRIELPKGRFVVRRQREYAPKAIRNVAD